MSTFEIGHIVSGVMACILIYVYEKFRRPGKLNTESNIYLLYIIAGYMSLFAVLFLILLSEMCFIFGWDFSNILSSIENRRKE